MEDEFDIDHAKNRQYIMYGVAVICIIIVITQGIKAYNIYDCKKEGGFLLDNKECYIPKNEEERQKILEQGYVETGYNIDEFDISSITPRGEVIENDK